MLDCSALGDSKMMILVVAAYKLLYLSESRPSADAGAISESGVVPLIGTPTAKRW